MSAINRPSGQARNSYRADWNVGERHDGRRVGRRGFDFRVGDGLLELLEFGSSKVALQSQTNRLAGCPENLNSLVVVEALQSLSVDLDDTVVDLDLPADVSGAAVTDALDENSRQFLCGHEIGLVKDQNCLFPPLSPFSQT